MATKGLYRVTSPMFGVETAIVSYSRGPGERPDEGEVSRASYEARRYFPPFDKLPTKEHYERDNPPR